MRVISSERRKNYLFIKTSCGAIALVPYTDSVVRIIFAKEEECRVEHKDSLIVCMEPFSHIVWHFYEEETALFLVTNKITIQLDKKTAAFTYRNKDGEVIAKEPGCGGKKIEPVKVYRNVFNGDMDAEEAVSTDGLRSHADNFETVFDRTAYHTKLEFEWGEGEALYGMGSHEEGILNYRGHQQYLYQQNLKCVIPVLISTKGYGILVDNYSLMTFHDDVYGSYVWTDVSSKMDYYFMYGPELDEIVRNYRQLTGKAPMLPKWAFGYIQSKECYRDRNELLQIVQEHRKRKIPLDVIVLDWKSWAGEFWGQKTLDPERFPRPEEMMEQLHSIGAKLMISIWPNLGKGGENQMELLRRGYMLGNQSTYNAFEEEARKLYWEQAEKGLFNKGIDAWWCDCSEPFEADWKGEIKPEPEQRVMVNTQEAKKYIDWQYINAYSLQHAKGIYEGQRRSSSEKRVVNLTRSSYAGQHRFSTISWSGDTSASWDVYRKQIADGLNFCVTGEPYWTVDIGGFFVGGADCWSKWREDIDSPACWFLDGIYGGTEDWGYRELYTRWFQYGTFLPLFRSHGTDYAREVWRFGEPGEVFYDTLLKFIHVRYRLMPYIYSIAGWVTHKDYTMMRLLAFDFRHDINTYNIADQFMFGPSLMICPVTEPMYFEAGSVELHGISKVRNVYLPAGSDWYDLWTGEKFRGGQTMEACAPIQSMPVYVRSGSIIPMGGQVQHTGEQREMPIEIRIYEGADAQFAMYEDEGDNYNYENGEFQITHIRWNDLNRTLCIAKRQGKCQSLPEEQMFRIITGKHRMDDEGWLEQEMTEICYNGDMRTISLV